MTISIASSAMLVDVSISTWTARKLDRSVTNELNHDKGASASASRVNKHLLPSVKALNEITKLGSTVRNWLYKETLPWSDYGPRLVPTSKFFEFKSQLDDYEQQFNDKVKNFLDEYPTLISAQAFELGDMFDRDEYPDVDQIAHRFRFKTSFIPVPESGDFRVDIGAKGNELLKQQYEAEYNARWAGAIEDMRERIIEGLKHISDRLDDNSDGERKRFRNDILEKFIDTLNTVADLNLTGDPDVQKMMKDSYAAIAHIDVEDVKENDNIRKDVRSRVNELLEAMDF